MSGAAGLDGYLFRNLARQAAGVAGERPELVDRWLTLLEEDGFLARQAEAESSFDPLSRDLEEHLLPILVERRDWPRFLRFALVAANLRDLVEELASPRLLRALAADRLALARNLTARQAEPLLRARGRAVLIAALEAQGRSHLAEFGALVEEVKSDLDDALGTGGGEPHREIAAVLAEVGRHAAVPLRHRWPGWLGELASDGVPTDDVRLAVADSLLARDAADGLGWELLSAVADRVRLGRRLGARPEWFDGVPPLVALRRLAELDAAGEGVFWSAVPPLVARLCRDGPAVEATFEAACRLRPPVWNLDTVSAGRPLWPRLPRRRVERLAARCDAEAAAALWLSLLPAADWAAERALQAIDALEEAAPWVHWSLRFLAADRSGDAQARRRTLSAIGIQLAELRFEVAAQDLALFLDLVADLDPGRLAAWVEDVTWGPLVDAGLLMDLADHVRRPAVLWAMLEDAERSAVTAAGSEARGFSLRLRLLRRLVVRLCRRRRDLEALRRVLPRLLPDEEDQVRLAVVSALAEEAPSLTSEVCDGIRSPRLRRRARLEQLATGTAGGELSPADLYAAFVDFEAVEDEIEALAALREPPVEPWRVAEERLSGIRHHGRRIAALSDLARHAIAFDRSLHPPSLRDPEAALLPLRRALGVVESERWLVEVTPQLVALGAVLGGRHALGELRLGFETVVAETSVPWAVREEVIERLLCVGTGRLVDGAGRCGMVRAVRWFRGLLDLPVALPRSSPAHGEVRRRWPHLLPRIVAAAERAPGPVMDGVRRPWRSLLALPAPGCGDDVAAAVAVRSPRWRWLDAAGREVVRCCAAGAEDRRRLAGRVGSGREAAGITVAALAWLLLREAPALASSMLDRIGDEAERDRLHLSLVLWAGMPVAERGAWRWPGAVRGARVRRRLRLAVAGTPEDERAALLDLLAAGGLDRDDPRWETVRRRLEAPGEAVTLALAGAVPAALARSGARAGFDAVRWWLVALLAVEAGRPPRMGSAALVAGLRGAVRRARSIAAS